ncbi:MAG: polysaccharide deacetylase family protein [Caulobacterales bacterium]
MSGAFEVYEPDRTWRGKLRRRAVRLAHRKPARAPARSMVSFCFDDAPVSAADAGAAVLEARGLRGTFFIAGDLAGRDGPAGRTAGRDEVRRLHAAGHEIGCHTFSHLDCGQAHAALVIEDVARNERTLAAWGVSRPTTFAYPYGDVAAPAKAALAGRFSLLRALHRGLITRGADLNQAPAVGIEGDHGEALARRWLRRAAGRPAWLILYTHDVADRPSPWGCSPAALARLADEAIGAGFEVVTAAQGAWRVG